MKKKNGEKNEKTSPALRQLNPILKAMRVEVLRQTINFVWPNSVSISFVFYCFEQLTKMAISLEP